MKTKALIFFIIICTSIISVAQDLPIMVNHISYKAETVDIYVHGVKQGGTYTSSKIFEFHKDKIKTYENLDHETFYKGSNVYKNTYHDVSKSKTLEYENGDGMRGFFAIGFHQGEQKYFIIVSDKNVDFLYICNVSRFGIPKGYVPMKGHKMFEGDYTNAEMRDFMNFLFKYHVNILEF
jgi:hypothetical protein